MSETNQSNLSVEFLLAEFAAQQSQIIKLEEAKSNRVNFFLVLVAAVAASTSVIIDKLIIPANATLALIALGILVFGLATLNELVNYSEAIVSLYRRAGRIRRWFVENNSEITPYLAFDATDERPKYDLSSAYLTFRGGDSVILLTNSLAFSVLTVSVLSLVYSLTWPIALIIVTVSAVLAWLYQQNRLHVRLRSSDASRKAHIHFPLQPLPDVQKPDRTNSAN
jgi:hypothetical protein